MKINYTKPQGGGKGDALTIIFKPDASYDEPEEIAEGVHAHHDHEGNVTAIEFYENASGKVDLSRLDISGLSLKTQEAHFA